MALTHLPSKRSIDLVGICYVNWDEKVFCISNSNRGLGTWYWQTSIYYHAHPETPVVILSDYDMYAQDIQVLQRELGVPQNTEDQTHCAEYQPGDAHFDEEYC